MDYRLTQNDLEKMRDILKSDGLYASSAYLEKRYLEICDHSDFEVDNMALLDMFDGVDTMLNLLIFPYGQYSIRGIKSEE